jgi:hypothetical protein
MSRLEHWNGRQKTILKGSEFRTIILLALGWTNAENSLKQTRKQYKTYEYNQ